ncbi:hypothetical protein [Adhaeribacter pallidiroseus]|uniref:Uncharacterized protein n=1 Tax=Adhaeribacter pallidiroseus TaxID=2072847 RepID=A0A369QCU5_9BACT|nr:hypothetical protein [Adhaeribacter pallidiroseus]RDC62160.1 hypothetical protein AHMF7616_00751 [Adhaeribacter pallidiroseus]
MNQKLVLLIFGLFSGQLLWAQTTDTTHAEPPKLFLNCPGNCFQDFVKTELSLFDIVRDQVQADIQVLVIDADNAGGGKLYTLTFYWSKLF